MSFYIRAYDEKSALSNRKTEYILLNSAQGPSDAL